MGFNCNSCNAPLPPNSNICEYCGSKNEIDLDALYKYSVTKPQEKSRFCPRCNIALQTINIRTKGQYYIEQCNECYGLFFDPGELETLIENSVSNVIRIDFERIDKIIETANIDPMHIEYLKCPICSQLMNRKSYGLKSGVIIDTCRKHGVWLDGGELRRIIEWKKAGGQLLHEERTERFERAEKIKKAILAERKQEQESLNKGDVDIIDLIFRMIDSSL